MEPQHQNQRPWLLFQRQHFQPAQSHLPGLHHLLLQLVLELKELDLIFLVHCLPNFSVALSEYVHHLLHHVDQSRGMCAHYPMQWKLDLKLKDQLRQSWSLLLKLCNLYCLLELDLAKSNLRQEHQDRSSEI